MKLNGRKATVNVVTEIFIREGQEPLVFKASAIMDGDEFGKLVPEPTPPSILRPGATASVPDYTDSEYIKKIQKRQTLQTFWMILKSLMATPGLEWETVDLNDPSSWPNINDELQEFGLSNVEKSKLIQAVMRANSLDERFIEAAKERFIRSQQALAAIPTSSLPDVPSNTKSGEPAKASA